MARICLLFVLLVVALSSPALSQTTYDTETIYLKGNGYVKNGVKTSRGFFWNNIAPEFEVSRDAVVEFKKAQKLHKVSSILAVAGTGLLIGSLFADNNDVAAGLAIGGLAVVVPALVIAPISGNKLQKAVWLRNRDVLY